MIQWKKGKDYPNIETLSEAFASQRTMLTHNLFKYWAVIILLTVIVFILAPNPYTIAVGIAALIVAFAYVAIKRRGYTTVAKIISTEDFYWTAGKAQNKWKRGMLDFASGNAYQVGMSDEWVECDSMTYNLCEIGKSMVLVRKSLEDKDCAYGMMIPEGGGFKQVKKIARNTPS